MFLTALKTGTRALAVSALIATTAIAAAAPAQAQSFSFNFGINVGYQEVFDVLGSHRNLGV